MVSRVSPQAGRGATSHKTNVVTLSPAVSVPVGLQWARSTVLPRKSTSVRLGGDCPASWRSWRWGDATDATYPPAEYSGTSRRSRPGSRTDHNDLRRHL